MMARKLSVIALAVMLACGLMPGIASASPLAVADLQALGDGLVGMQSVQYTTAASTSERIAMSFLKGDDGRNTRGLIEVGKVSKLKCNDPAVVEVSCAERAYDGAHVVTVRAQKTGCAVVTYKAGNAKRTLKVAVRKYANPAASIKVGSVDYAPKFKSSRIFLTPSSKRLSGKIVVKSALGWKVKQIIALNTPEWRYIKSGKSIKGQIGLQVTFANKSTGVEETVLVTNEPMLAM